MLDWWNINKNNFDYEVSIPILQFNIDPLTASHNAIKFILEKYPSPYTLMLSGGVDSQAMLWAWYTSGAKFTPLSFRYNIDMNDHDLKSMPMFLEKNKINLNIKYRDLDVLDFYQYEYFSYVENYRCGSPHICVYMKMCSLIESGTVIFSGEILRYPNLPISKNIWGLYHYALSTGRPMVPYFFLETAELAWSFKNKFPYEGTDKPEVYRQKGFPVVNQASSNPSRYSGFEKIKDYYDDHYAHLVTIKDKMNKLPNQRSSRVYDILLRNKFEKKFINDKYEMRYLYA